MITEGSWLKFNLRDKYDYYYNIDSKEGSWVPPESWAPKESWLTGKEIEVGVDPQVCDVKMSVSLEKFFCHRSDGRN